MSATIDQRIVEMRFDNKEFEKNVSTTMSSLDKLKQKLNLDGMSKGLDDVNAAAKRVDMSTLGDGVEKVGLKFSALYTIADQALRNITTAAFNAGTRIVKALTIDPITTGFKEYETQINAIQTILANTESKGTTLTDVNSALDELNAYADKTIYNFTEMTRNIGTFTAAGVDLDTSVSAIKGIANLAAVSGSTSQQASTAMYQLSQALSSGTVRLMDWNSVVNAGMGGQVFQDALKETARVHGIAIDDIIKQEGSFRESLSHGWLSSEILTETLAKFTGDLNAEQLKTMGYTEEQIEGILKLGQTANDAATKVKTFSQLYDTLKEAAQSGWAQSWEIIVGDFEEARTLLTKVSDTIGGLIGKSADARNDLLENWKVLGGRTAVIDALTSAFDAVMSIAQAVSEAMKEVFPPLTSEKLVAFCNGLKELAQRFAEVFKVNGKTTSTFNNLKRTLKGVFAVVDIVRQVFVAFAKIVGKLFGVTGNFAGGLLEVTAGIGDWLVALSDAIEHSKIFERVVSAVGDIIDFVAGIVSDFGRVVTESFVFKAASKGLYKFVELISTSQETTKKLADSASNVKNAWENSGLYRILSSIWGIMKAVGNGAKTLFDNLFGGMSEAFGSVNWNSMFDVVSGILGGGFMAGLIVLVKSLTEVVDNTVGIFEELGDTLGAFQNKVNSEALKNIATALAILVASIVVLAILDEDKLTSALAALTIVMTMLTLMMMIMSKGKKLGKIDVDMMSISSNLIGMSVALLIAAGAFAILGSMDMASIGKGILGMLGVMTILIAAQFALSKFASAETTFKKGTKAMRSMALTLLLMCAPLAIIGTMEWVTIIKGLVGITAVLALLVAASVMCSKFDVKSSVIGSLAMMVMAVAITSLVPPLLLIGSMSTEALIKAGLALIAILGTFMAVQVIYSKLGAGIGGMMAGAAAIRVMAFAITTLTPMLLILGAMSWQSLLKAVTGIVAVLGTFMAVQVIYSKLGAGIGGMLAGSAAIIVMAFALNSLIPTLLSLALLPWSSLLKAGLGLIGILTSLSVALLVVSKLGGGGGNVLAASIAIAVMANSMVKLATALAIVGSVNPGRLATGLLVLTAALAVLVAIGYLIQPVIGYLSAFAKAIALIGLGAFAAGAGFVLFGIGLTAVAAGITALVGAIGALVGSLGVVANALIVLVAALVEGIIRGIGAGIVALCSVLIDSLPLIAQVCIELIGALCDVIVTCVPKIVDTILILVLKICEGFVKFIPPIVAAIVRLIAGILDALAQELPGLIKSSVGLLFAFVEGMISALGGMDSKLLLQAVMNVGMLAFIMAALVAIGAMSPLAMAGAIAMLGVVTTLSYVLAILGALAYIPGLNELIGKGGGLLQSIGTAIGQFAGGIVGGFAKGATADLPEIASNLSGFANNIGDFLAVAPALAASLASLAGASIATAIADFLNFGGGSMDVFAKDLPVLGTALTAFSKATAGINPEQVKGAALAAQGIAEMTSHIPNSGGMVSWITGDNSIAKFGSELGSLGHGIKSFAIATAGINPEQVKGAALAAQTIAEMTNCIPNSGGVVSWFAGDNSISKFSEEIGSLGRGIKAFAVATTGVIPEQIIAAANAAKVIAEMTNNIPNSGGVVSWFAGDNSVANFSMELGLLGTGIKSFATATTGVNPEQVVAAANAAKALAEMTNYIPNSGGVVSWFTGENSVSKFSGDMLNLGIGINAFAVATAGVNPEQVVAAANAAKAIAEMTSHIPNSEGVAQWWAGETSVAKFADQLPALGKGLSGFAKGLGDADMSGVASAATAAKALADMTQYVPKSDGIAQWFTGEASISKFANELPKLGAGLLGFSNSINGMNPTNVEVAATAAKHLAEMTETVPGNSNKIVTFGENIGKFGKKMKAFIAETAGITVTSTNGANVLVALAKDAATIDASKIKAVATAISELTKAAKNMEKDIKSDMKDAGKKAVEGYINGLNDKLKDAKNAISDLVDKVAGKASEKASAFAAAGKDCVQGFANGIKNHKYLATNAGSEVGKAALEAAKKAVDSNSPSKEFMKLGRDSDVGFANGLSKYSDMVYDSGYDVGSSGLSGLGDSISKISRLVENGIDDQPHIRPVLDLSDVENGVGRIGGLFADTPLGVNANLGAISSMMGSRAQNGSNKDVTDAIKELRADISKIKNNTYNINGITYDDGSSIAEAVSTLIRAAKMERRV